MKLIVNPHAIEIKKEEAVNEKEIDISKCEFEFNEEITDSYVKEAYFTLNGSTYKQIIVNNMCSIPYEVLIKPGTVEIGVVAYLVEDETEIKRYNPSPAYFKTDLGSLKDAQNSQQITPSEMEQYEQALQDGLSEVNDKIDAMDTALRQVDNLDIDANKVGTTTTVTITKKNGTTKEVQVLDGTPGQNGTNGKDAKINNVNTLTLEAGDNITLNQEGSTLTISATGGGSGGTSDYEELEHLPKINNVELKGNKTTSDLGISYEDLSNKPTIPTVPTNVSAFTNDAGYTTNTGTITSVKMNGSTISSSGEADLGTVITDISGKEDKITSSNKLSSDLIDDTNKTNKFVTTSEKTTWNSKQDTLIAGDNIAINSNTISATGINPTITTSSTSTYTIASLTGNNVYKLGEITALTITATTTFDRESVIYFESGTTATEVSLPSSITNLGDAPTMTETSGVNSGTCTASKNYIIAIENNIAVWKEY